MYWNELEKHKTKTFANIDGDSLLTLITSGFAEEPRKYHAIIQDAYGSVEIYDFLTSVDILKKFNITI